MAQTVTQNEPTYEATQWTGENQQEIVDAVLSARPYGELNSADVDSDGALHLNFIAAGQFTLSPDHYLIFGPIFGDYNDGATIVIVSPVAFEATYSPV